MAMNNQDAAALLGMGEDEVVDVQESKAGPVIRTVDGNAYVIVPEDKPDADGQTGLMFLVPPNPKYQGTFPVFAGAVKQEDKLLKSLGIDLEEAPARPGEDVGLSPGDVDVQSKAVVTDPGPAKGRRAK